MIDWSLYRWKGVQIFAAEGPMGSKTGSPTAREWLDWGSKHSAALGPGVHKEGVQLPSDTGTADITLL